MSKNKGIKTIILVAVAIILLGIAIAKVINNKKYEVKLTQIEQNDIKYYVLKKEQKYGVIDNEGSIIVEPTYRNVEIPNPTTDLFICTESDDLANPTWKAINASNEQVLAQYNISAIQINQLTSYVPYEKNVLKYKDGSLYGIIDLSGKKITEAIYEEISGLDYKEGYLKVKENGLYGIINIKGTTIIKPEYENITADGYYSKDTKYSKAGFILRTKTDNGYKFGYATYNGKVVLEPIYNEVNRITEIEDDKNVYLLSSTNGKYGLTKNEKQIIENEYEDIVYDKTSNLLIVNKDEIKGVYNIEGKIIIPIDYTSITIGGDYINAIKNETRVIFDISGQKLDTDITSHLKVSDNYSIIIDKDNNYNIVDNSNNKLLNDKYVYIEFFKDNLFIATQENRTGLIDANGKIIVPLKYGTVQKIEKVDLLEAAEIENGKIDLIDEKGNILEGLEDASLEKNDEYIKIYSKDDAKYFKLDGTQVEYKELYPSNSLYAKKQNGKWGFVNSNGNTVVDYIYDMVTEQNGKFAGIKSGELWGVIDENGNVILEPKYSLIYDDVKFLSTYYELKDSLGVPTYCGDYENNY